MTVKMKKIILFVMLCLSIVVKSNAQTLFSEYVGNPAKAKYSAELLGKAESGDANAQYKLGLCYESANGVPFNMDEAQKWYELSAQNGNEPAIEKIANMYLCGIGVEQNYPKALSYYNHFGDSHLFQKGACYLGIGQDDKAIACFEKYLYEYYPQMKKTDYLNVDAKTSYKDVTVECLQQILQKGIADKEKNKKLKKLLKFQEKDDFVLGIRSRKYCKMGICYYYGIGVSRDYQKAMLFFEKDIKKYPNNSPESHNYIGMMYFNGLGVKRDYFKSIDYLVYFKRCFPSLDYVNMTTMQAIMNSNGYSGFWAVAKHNLAIAQYYCGEQLYKQKDYNEAFKYLTDAATNPINPIPQAMRMLSACYRYGLGTKIDRKEEADWLERAKNYNDEKALKILNGF